MTTTQSDDPNGEADRPDQRVDSPVDPTSVEKKSTEEIAALYGEIADSLHRWRWADRLLSGRYRRRQFGDARGRTLDIACGTGTNFRYLPPSADLVGIDISREMLQCARDELDGLRLNGSLYEMDAQALEFSDDSFDTVISAFSTCTFPDPVAALREMERVCKPGGRILLLEHGRSDIKPVSRFLDWRADAHYRAKGCRWNQEPAALVRESGLPVVEIESAFLGMISRIEARPSLENDD